MIQFDSYFSNGLVQPPDLLNVVICPQILAILCHSVDFFCRPQGSMPIQRLGATATWRMAILGCFLGGNFLVGPFFWPKTQCECFLGFLGLDTWDFFHGFLYYFFRATDF